MDVLWRVEMAFCLVACFIYFSPRVVYASLLFSDSYWKVFRNLDTASTALLRSSLSIFFVSITFSFVWAFTASFHLILIKNWPFVQQSLCHFDLRDFGVWLKINSDMSGIDFNVPPFLVLSWSATKFCNLAWWGSLNLSSGVPGPPIGLGWVIYLFFFS